MVKLRSGIRHASVTFWDAVVAVLWFLGQAFVILWKVVGFIVGWGAMAYVSFDLAWFVGNTAFQWLAGYMSHWIAFACAFVVFLTVVVLVFDGSYRVMRWFRSY